MSHLDVESSQNLPRPVIEYIARLNARSASQWTFAQGLMVGQLTVLLVLAAFLKFFVFVDSADFNEPYDLRYPSAILAKTYYNTVSHRAESLDWFNVLVAQAFAQFRHDARSQDAILISLDAIFNGSKRPDFLDKIKVIEVNLGEEFPIFSNCRIGLTDDESKRLHAQMDVDISDSVTLAIETRVLLNYPSPAFVALPIALGVTIRRFSGALSVALVPPADENKSTTMTFSFSPNFTLDLEIHSLLGSRSRLQDLPKISQLVETQLRQWLCERCVEPRYQRIDIPSFWPTRAKEGSKVHSDSAIDLQL